MHYYITLRLHKILYKSFCAHIIKYNIISHDVYCVLVYPFDIKCTLYYTQYQYISVCK